MKELEGMEPDDEAFESTFIDMMHDVEHHVGEEEGEMFPLAEEALGDCLEELGAEMMRRKHDLMESALRRNIFINPQIHIAGLIRTAACTIQSRTRGSRSIWDESRRIRLIRRFLMTP